MQTSMLRSQFLGARPQQRPAGQANRGATVMAVKKVNSLDTEWKKGFWGTGIFLEDNEKPAVNIFKKVEQKKVLSSVEKLGLLSAAEKAGFSLSKIEKLGLLSTAERLGLLSLLDELLVTDPGKITSASIPFFLGAIFSLVLIPQDNAVEVALAYTLALLFGGAATTLFVGGFVLKGLQDE